MSNDIITPSRDCDAPRRDDCHDNGPDDCRRDEDVCRFSWKRFIYYLVAALLMTALYFVVASAQSNSVAKKGVCHKTSGGFSFVFFLVALLFLYLFVVFGHDLFKGHRHH